MKASRPRRDQIRQYGGTVHPCKKHRTGPRGRGWDPECDDCGYSFPSGPEGEQMLRAYHTAVGIADQDTVYRYKPKDELDERDRSENRQDVAIQRAAVAGWQGRLAFRNLYRRRALPPTEGRAVGVVTVEWICPCPVDHSVYWWHRYNVALDCVLELDRDKRRDDYYKDRRIVRDIASDVIAECHRREMGARLNLAMGWQYVLPRFVQR